MSLTESALNLNPRHIPFEDRQGGSLYGYIQRMLAPNTPYKNYVSSKVNKWYPISSGESFSSKAHGQSEISIQGGITVASGELRLGEEQVLLISTEPGEATT